MAEQTGRIRVVLRWIQILDTMEPAWKEKGEFRFTSRVSTDNAGGKVREMRFPEQGHYDISDHPAWNKVVMNASSSRMRSPTTLSSSCAARSWTRSRRTTTSNTYRREFTGDPASWVGWYGPGDDTAVEINPADPENMSNWRVCYVIENA
jgi:hypothetical protein